MMKREYKCAEVIMEKKIYVIYQIVHYITFSEKYFEGEILNVV